jgi:integrase/recombinase XerD
MVALRLISGMGTNTNHILAQWRGWQTAQGLSLRTINERDYFLRHFLTTTGAEPLAILPEHIIAYIGRPGIGQSSRSTYHKHLRAYSRWLIKTQRRVDDPTLQTPVPKQPRGLPRPVSQGDLSKILLAAKRPKARMMILLASLQGLRVHEIAKVRGEEIDAGSLTLTVTGKGNKTAFLPLHETVAMFAANFPQAGHWFPAADGNGGVAPNSVSRVIKRTMQNAGVNATPHALRHYFGSTLVQNGVDLRTVQELLRHESLATTQIYTQVPDSARRTAIAGLTVA